MASHLMGSVRGPIGKLLQIASVLLISAVGALAQPAIRFTEFPMPTSGRPGITTGPDGALWFTEFTDKIGRITTSGVVTEFPLPDEGVFYPEGRQLLGITAGPDGALWFTESRASRIGRITVSGVITEYLLPRGDSAPQSITAGPDGALWYTEYSRGVGRIGRITTAGAVTEYDLPPCGDTCGNYPEGIAAGPDGALWFTNLGDSTIWRITTAGVLTKAARFITEVGAITVGSDGALWFSGGDTAGPCDNVGRITTTGALTPFPLPIYPRPGFNGYNNLAPGSIAPGRDGALWFAATRVNVLGRVTTDGLVTLFPLPGGSIDDDTWVQRSITTGPDGALWIANKRGIVRGAMSRLSGGVQVEMKPGSWRNRLDVTSLGALPVAILGTASLDVERIDVSSLRLEGVPTASWKVKDVEIDAGVCGSQRPDGRADLMLSFRIPEIVAALRPPPGDGEVRVLRLTGNLKAAFGGKRIHGQGVVVVKVP